MRNSYTLILIVLKLFRCCDHALKICMWLGYTSRIIFVTFLQFEFCHFSDIFTIMKVRCLDNAFKPILLKLYIMCFGHALKICL